MLSKKQLDEAAKALSRRGGVATLKKHGKKHFKEMAKKRWLPVATKKATKK